MVVDVLYEGLEVAKGAEAREQDGALFVSLASPMPVGTRLTLRSDKGDQVARVEQVNEQSGGSGVLVRVVGAGVAVGPPPDAEAGGAPEPPEPEDKKRGGRKRKNTKNIERH
jgi:hypothetical protein